MVADRSGTTMARSTLTFLRQKIISGEWPINSRIPRETDLMELIGVGKSTIREAVRALASLGMLETIRGVGTFVRSRSAISPVLTEFIAEYGMDQILVYRRALEVEAAQLAAANRTEEQVEQLRTLVAGDAPGAAGDARTERGTTPGQFHHLIFEAAGVPLLAAMYSGVMAAVRRAMDHGQIVYGAPQQERHSDHALLVAKIAEQDVAGAAHAMVEHVERDLVPEQRAQSIR